jgi:TolA-binding protein
MMKLSAALLLPAILSAGVGIALPRVAQAQMESREAIALQNQIAELRQEIQIMQQTQQTGGPAPSPYVPAQPYQPQGDGQAPGAAPPQGSDTAAELVVRVGTLEEQNRQLQGRVDDLTNQLQHQHDDLAKQISDLAFKLQNGVGAAPEQGGAPAAPPPAEAPPPRAVAPPAAHRTPEMALHDGNAALARRDYAAAEAAAREALRGHVPHTVDAQFLLARAEGGEHQYKAAAADFYQAYNHAPKSNTAPVALLGVANALIALNDNHDACEALAKLTVEFPGALKPGVSSARKRAACGR